MDVGTLLAAFPVMDVVAPAFFVACWIGYARWAEGGAGFSRSVMARVHDYRMVWMRRMLQRDIRIPDLVIVQVLTNSISFFASSAVLIVGGGLAVLGAREQAMAVVAQIPFASQSPPLVWECKVLLICVVFVYAFFKFTWALRQFNYVAIMIGAAPPPEEADSDESQEHAERAARLASRAAEHFNKAMRSYYFGMGAISWFLHPLLLIAVTTWVVLIVYRREYRSRTAMVLGVGETRPGGHASRR